MFGFFRKNKDVRVYNLGRILCPFCDSLDCCIRMPRKGWQRFIPFAKLYHCTDTNKQLLVVLGFSKHGLCREHKVVRTYKCY